MKIAFFTDTYLPIHDGVAHVVADIADTLAKGGHSVTVFTAKARGSPDSETSAAGVTIHRSSSIPLPYYPQYRTAILPWKKVMTSLKGTDVVHIHTPGMVGFAGLLAARHEGIPTLGTFHTNIKDMRKSLPDRWSTRLFFRYFWLWNLGIYARCNLVTVPADPARELMLSSFRPGKGAPVVVLPNGISLHRFNPGITVPDWPLRLGLAGVPLVTYMGRLTKDKGVHRFLDALSILPRDKAWAGVIAGEGPEAASIRFRVLSEPTLRERVRIVGPVLEEEKAALLSQSRVFVLASTADVAPIVILEAMASGAALVVTSQGGPGKMVTDGITGLLVDPENIPSIRDAIERLISESELSHRLSTEALAWVRENASIERMGRELLGAYADIRHRSQEPRNGLSRSLLH